MFFTAARKEDKRKAMDNILSSDDSDEDFDSVVTSHFVQDLPKKALYVLKVVFECKAWESGISAQEFFVPNFRPGPKFR